MTKADLINIERAPFLRIRLIRAVVYPRLSDMSRQISSSFPKQPLKPGIGNQRNNLELDQPYLHQRQNFRQLPTSSTFQNSNIAFILLSIVEICY